MQKDNISKQSLESLHFKKEKENKPWSFLIIQDSHSSSDSRCKVE